MALRPVQVNIKAHDCPAVGRFWGAALGWSVFSPGVTTYVAPTPAGEFAWPDPVAVAVDVVPVPEADEKRAKNRVHVDLATTSAAHQAELVARLLALGATPADVGQGAVPWTVLADPEGNEFCVLEPRETYRKTGPIAAVVVDCADPRAMARFWHEATGWTPHEVADDLAALRPADGSGPYLEFLRTPDVKTAPDRVHLDLLPYPGADRAAEVARLRVLGATDLDVGQGNVPWTCLTDPEGHEFCVLAPFWAEPGRGDPHAAVTAAAPSLRPKLWYGMPSYALDGKVVCFFQAAAKFKTRYATLGFSDLAKLDEGTMWANGFALTAVTAEVEKRIAELVTRAVG